MGRQGQTIVALLGAVNILLMISLGVFWLARSPSIFANLIPEGPDEDIEASSEHQVAGTDQLPEHPFEHMGVAGLSPIASMPDNAIPETQAIDIVTGHTWGPHRDELVKDYPPSVIPAVYNARESVMGPSVQERPVWVVTLEGWGPAGRCGVPGPPGPEGPEDDPEAQTSSEPASEAECIPGKSNAYAIVDAVSGQILAGWHYGTRAGE